MELSEQVAISPKQAAEIGATSLTKYGKLFFPRTFRQDSPGFHEEIGAALYGPDRYNAFKVFRDGAKTSLLRVYASQRIAYGISRTIMYVSVSQQHAMFSVRWVRRQVQFNTRWAQTFGLTKGEKWTDEWAEIKCNLLQDESGMPVTVTMLAMGITGQIRGFNPDDFRPDLIIIDDILNEENTATPEQRQKIDALVFGALLNSLAPATESPLAKAVFLQTPLNKEDAIEKCMKDPQWNPKSFGVFDEAGESRWPSRYPTATLLAEKQAAIRRSQYRIWMREKECTLVSGEEKAIDISKLKYWDVLPERMDKIISIDPASSDSPKADKFVNLALGVRGMDVYVIAYSAAEKNDPGKATNDCFNLVLLTHPRKIAVESVAFQRVFKWILEQEMQKRKLFVMVEELKIGKTSNADRIMQTIPGLVAFGHMYLHPGMTELISQMDDYDPTVKDISDDYLTALANGIISINPALRHLIGDASSDEAGYEDDESEYKPLRVRAAP